MHSHPGPTALALLLAPSLPFFTVPAVKVLPIFWAFVSFSAAGQSSELISQTFLLVETTQS